MCVNRLIPLGIQQGAGPSLDMKRVSTDPCDTEGCTMAMPQRDETIEEIKRLDALLEYAVMHGEDVICLGTLFLVQRL